MIARVRVLESLRLTPTVHGVKFEKPPGFEFAPVQFCGLELTTPTGPVEYPMSLACSPTRPHLEFAARDSGSPWKEAFAALRPGDVAEVDGAYGHFLLDETAPAVLLAGGIGITPLKGMAEFANDRHLDVDVRLGYSSRNEQEIAYRSELDLLTKENPRFQVFHTLSRVPEDSDWRGRRGRMDPGFLKELARGLAHPVYYVCGAPGMVRETIRNLQQLGVEADRIRFEAFPGYGRSPTPLRISG